MQTPRVIAISGPKYSGKDTAASSLLGLRSMPDKRGFVFCRMPFAAGVKNICQEVFGWDPYLLEDPILKEQKTEDYPFIEPRWPMMDIANWMRDKYGGDVWVRRNARKINEIHASNPYWAYVITDWRFPEETEWLNSLGPAALKIYIQRDEAEEKLASAQQSGNEMALNPSEMHYANTRAAADIIIPNNREIHNLHNEVMMAVRNKFGYWYPDEPETCSADVQSYMIAPLKIEPASLHFGSGEKVVLKIDPDGTLHYDDADEAAVGLHAAWQRIINRG